MIIAKKSVIRAYLLLLLLALEIMMSFSMFGYIEMGGITISFVPIIVYCAGYAFGMLPAIGAGLIFGLSSMWMAHVTGGVGADTLYAPFLSGNPLASLVLAVGTRLLLGVMAGHAMQVVQKRKRYRRPILTVTTIAVQLIYTGISYIVTKLSFSGFGIDGLIDNTAAALNLSFECIISAIFMLGLDYVLRLDKTKRMIESFCYGREKVPRSWTAKPIIVMGVFFAVSSFGTTTRFLVTGLNAIRNTDKLGVENAVAIFKQLEAHQQLAYISMSVIIIIAALLAYYYYIARETEILRRADTDPMTGLYNRVAFMERIRKDMSRTTGESCAFLMLDLDDLKGINDTLGHVAGDEAIMGMAQALNTAFRESDFIARIGGDEFAVFLHKVPSRDTLKTILERVMRQLAAITIADGKRSLHACIGVALGTSGQDDVETLYSHADEALYKAKRNTKGSFAFYDEEK